MIVHLPGWLDVTSRVQDPDNVNSACNGQVEDQVIPEPSDLGTSKPLQARVGNLIGCAYPWRASQSRKRRFGSQAKPPCGIGIAFADIRIASSQIDPGCGLLEDDRIIHRALRALRVAMICCPSRSISSQSWEVIGVDGPESNPSIKSASIRISSSVCSESRCLSSRKASSSTSASER